jgi:hypothetical protein
MTHSTIECIHFGCSSTHIAAKANQESVINTENEHESFDKTSSFNDYMIIWLKAVFHGARINQSLKSTKVVRR